MTTAPCGIGLVGAGAFGAFCLAAFAELPDVRIAAVADIDTARADHFAAQYGARACTDLDAMLTDPAVQIVALNTPPALHAAQGLAVLRAGKHLFCEKPLALRAADGEQLIAAAAASNRLLTIDYVMRQNPLWEAAAALRASGLLGDLLHMDLTNHAAGLDLPATHWFWDKAQSGGIWIEHGVHFFDAFAWVAGAAGEVNAARAYRRANGREDRVEALAHYGSAAAHFYHGFTHSGPTEQTTVRLTFTGGYVTLDEWVPTALTLVTRQPPAALAPLLPGTVTVDSPPDAPAVIRAVLPEGKSAVYRRAIQDGMRQLARAAQGDTTALRVTGALGLDSLRMAERAEQLATAEAGAALRA